MRPSLYYISTLFGLYQTHPTTHPTTQLPTMYNISFSVYASSENISTLRINSVLHWESDGVSILYTFLALLNCKGKNSTLYFSRSNRNNLKFFLMEHSYFYAPAFSRDLYEILMIRYVLNSKP